MIGILKILVAVKRIYHRGKIRIQGELLLINSVS